MRPSNCCHQRAQWQACKASHCGSKQQQEINLLLLVRARVAELRFLGGVGFVRTLEVGVGFFYPKWIIFYIAHLFWNSYWNTESCCVPRFSLIVSCYKIVDSQTSFILCYGVGNFVRVGHFTSDSVPLVRTTYTVYMCCFSRTSRSWCIAHSTPRLPSGCNAGNAGEAQCLTSSSAFQKLLFLISKVLRQFSDRFYCVIS